MGLPIQFAYLLLREHLREPFSGDVLQLGRQWLYFTRDEWSNFAEANGLRLPDDFVDSFDRFDDGELFRSIGFSGVSSCDISETDSPTFLIDLNRPLAGQAAELEREKYDVVFNGGTIEHCFHLPNALANACDLVRPGGRAIHLAPSSNNMDHGFYMFSPTLFYDYYLANGWRIDTALVTEMVFGHNTTFTYPMRMYRYEPGCLDRFASGGMRDFTYTLFFVATKLPCATSGVIPQQSYYSRVGTAPNGVANRRPLKDFVKRLLPKRKYNSAVTAVRRSILRPALPNYLGCVNRSGAVRIER